MLSLLILKNPSLLLLNAYPWLCRWCSHLLDLPRSCFPSCLRLPTPLFVFFLFFFLLFSFSCASSLPSARLTIISKALCRLLRQIALLGPDPTAADHDVDTQNKHERPNKESNGQHDGRCLQIGAVAMAIRDISVAVRVHG